MIETHFHHKRKENVENKNNSPVNIRFVTKNIRHFFESIRSDVKTSELPTLALTSKTIASGQISD